MLPTHKKTARRGYTLLFIVLIISLMLVILYIPLIRITTSGAINTVKQNQTRAVYYATEAGVHDAIARMVATNLAWPPVGTTSQPFTIDNVTVSRTVTRDATSGDIDIGIDTQYRTISRDFTVNITSHGQSGGTNIMDVAIAIDVSGSMDDESEQSGQFPCDNGSQPKCQPLNSARDAAKSLVDQIFAQNSSARISIITFSNYATVQLGINDPQSSNPNHIKNAVIDQIRINPLLTKTNIGDGFHEAKLQLDQNSNPGGQTIVLISDGSANMRGHGASATTACPNNPIVHNTCTIDANQESVSTRSSDAKNAGYTNYVVGLNLINLAPNAHSVLARDTLISAASSETHYFDSPTTADLSVIFNSIGNQILSQPDFRIQENY